MVQLNPKITASFTFHGTEMKDVEVINPGDWSGTTWLLGISCGFDTDFYIVEADSACDAIDELVDSGKGEYLVIDEAQFGDYGVATDNPTCSFAGNNGRPVCLDNLMIHGDDRTGFECLYHVEGWGAPVKPKDLSDVIEKMETVAQWREDTKRPGKFQACEAYAAYYWDSESDEDIEDRFGNLISRYEVTAEDRLMFPELANVATVYLRETEDGFVVESDAPDDDDRAEYDENGDLINLDVDNLDEFTTAYIETALWSSMDESNESGGEPLDANYGIDDIAPETLKEMIADCQDFQASFGELVADDLERAGHDFWLTRNGHGAGFWDGDWDSPLPDSVDTSKPYATVGDYLTDMSEPYGSVDLYVGDDGKIYA